MKLRLAVSFLVFCSIASTLFADDDAAMMQRARKLSQSCILIDTHIDVPYRLQEKMEDITGRTASGEFDYVRAKAGGLNAAFMSIYIPASYEGKGAKKYAERLIDLVDSIVAASPDKFAVAVSVADVRSQLKKGLVSLPMGMENGSPIEGKLSNIKYFYDRGIRYITLAHGKRNHISDSSYDEDKAWNGLSPFGKEVVGEMNRVGIMVDVSHITDSAFYQVIRISKAPVIASHSACRVFTPGFERNMNDDMIQLLAKNGGVIQINFGSSFLTAESHGHGEIINKALTKYNEEHKLQSTDSLAVAYETNYRAGHPAPFADVKDVVAHIDHVVKLVGVDYVGIGSDFDGVGDSLPTGLKDVSQYPNLIYELLKIGYSEPDIKKICGENLLRVWSNVEKTARKLQRK
ncbi:MAG: dipeptidase [bacterium]